MPMSRVISPSTSWRRIQQVGSFEVVNRAGVLVKNGGNVASYFCTPDGRVIHAVTGPVSAEELLTAARWVVDVASGGGAVDDSRRIAAAHREMLQDPSRAVASPAEQKVHRLLASKPLPPLNEVYRTVFEDILGQRVSPPDTEREQVERAFAAARRAKLPVLLILHKARDNQMVLEEWNRLVASPGPVVADQRSGSRGRGSWSGRTRWSGDLRSRRGQGEETRARRVTAFSRESASRTITQATFGPAGGEFGRPRHNQGGPSHQSVSGPGALLRGRGDASGGIAGPVASARYPTLRRSRPGLTAVCHRP